MDNPVKIIVAIDGWSSCGKSTLAKQLAKKLNYIYIDSGAMYRAITLYLLQNNIAIGNEDFVGNVLPKIHLEFRCNSDKNANEIFLNNQNVEQQIRESFIADSVSDVARLPVVREYAVALQQKMGLQKGIIMDGRDIGTVVFPDAEIKFFINADIEVRAARRFKELAIRNPQITFDDVKNNLLKRDMIDSTRSISPLKMAGDAFSIDNTHLSIEEQFSIAYQKVLEKIAGEGLFNTVIK